MGSSLTIKKESYRIFMVVYMLFLAHFGWCDNAQPLELKVCGFNAIYQFGDSLSDTGNFFAEIPPIRRNHFPYGETVGKVMGRYSDGLLIVDYLSESTGLPYTQPYTNPFSTFPGGPNFAVVGATALPKKILSTYNLSTVWTSSSLDVQLKWFENYLKTKVCSNATKCPEKLKSALFMVGPIGSNDHSLAIFANMNVTQIKDKLTPKVVKAIKKGVSKVISYGAKRVVVPSLYPMGCWPSYIQRYSGKNNSLTYDELGCIETYNELFRYYNIQVQNMIQGLSRKYPDVHIAYEDLYGAFSWIFNKLPQAGILNMKMGCCGTGSHRASLKVYELCGTPGVYVCSKPSDYVFFDGWNPTQITNQILAKMIIKDILPKLQCG